MKIRVVANISEEKKVSTKVDKLPIENAIEKLREYADITYIKDKERIFKIMVFPKREETELSKPIKEEGSVKSESNQEETITETPQPEPFKFEFDPSQHEE